MTGEVVSILKERGATLAVAESCTGGRLAAAFTEAAGASDYFIGGVVAYANEVKMNVLGVPREILERHGAVSREVAEAMASGARRVFGADYAVSTTGIAGPGGGTLEKPIGTVWIAVADTDGVTSQIFNFHGSRTENMESAVAAAIEMLAEKLVIRN